MPETTFTDCDWTASGPHSHDEATEHMRQASHRVTTWIVP